MSYFAFKRRLYHRATRCARPHRHRAFRNHKPCRRHKSCIAPCRQLQIVRPLVDQHGSQQARDRFLPANPDGTDRLALDREAHAIHVELKRTGYRDRFGFQTGMSPMS